MEKITRATAQFCELQNSFMGLTITLRHYLADDKILIRLDDNFAKANGFNTMEEVYKVSPMMRGYEWLDTKLIEEAQEFASRSIS